MRASPANDLALVRRLIRYFGRTDDPLDPAPFQGLAPLEAARQFSELWRARRTAIFQAGLLSPTAVGAIDALQEIVARAAQSDRLRAASTWPAIRSHAGQAFSLIPHPERAHILAGWPPVHLAAVPPTEDGLRDLFSIVDERRGPPDAVDPREWETELSAGLARLGEAYEKVFFEEMRVFYERLSCHPSRHPRVASQCLDQDVHYLLGVHIVH